MATAEDIQYHYDVSNEFYGSFLDAAHRMYSCAVWDGADSLEEAQRNKLNRIVDFAKIKKDDEVLDIGCGWGGMMQHLVREKNVSKVTGLTLSLEQKSYIDGLKFSNIEANFCGWQDFRPQQNFDAIVSIGAFEHFASLEDRTQGKQIDIYRNFFDLCAKWSKKDGYLALQTIVTSKYPDTLDSVRGVRFLLKEIFPGSALPSIDDIQEAICGIYEIQELRTIGEDYARTLQAWKDNIERNESSVVSKFGKTLYDHYRKYFEVAKNNFEGGYTNLVQISLKRKSQEPWFIAPNK